MPFARPGWPAALAAAVCLAAPALPAGAPPPGAFSVGVLRRDGILIPFAAFDGRRWAAPWPLPQADLEIPIDPRSVPKGWWGPAAAQTAWQLWPAAGGDPRTVTVTRTDWIEAHCLRQIALGTDYLSQRPIPPRAEQPYPKDGLVVAPPRPIEPVEIVPPDSLEASRMARAVAAAFNRAERDLSGRQYYPIQRDVREPMPVTMEAIYAFGTAPRLYYVEAARGYRAGLAAGGECAVAFGTGWFSANGAGDPKSIDMAVDLLSCNRDGATYMLPFGVVRAGGRVFWTAQFAGWDHERYMVIEIKKESVQAVLARGGGGC